MRIGHRTKFGFWSKAAIALSSCSLLIGSLPTTVWAQAPGRSLASVPADERRSQIVDVIGETPVQGNAATARSETERMRLRDLAANEAKAIAIKKVADSLGPDASLLPRSGKAHEDAILVSIQELPMDAGVFRVAARVEVRLFPNTVIGLNKNGEQPFNVTISAPKTEYFDGEEIIVTVKGNRDFYGKITYQDANGNIVQVLPNKFRSDNLFKANTEYKIPGSGDKFKLKVTAPYGRERFTVYSSVKPLGAVPGEEALDRNTGLSKLPGNQQSIGSKTRGLQVIENQLAQNPADFYEATFELVTYAPPAAKPQAVDKPQASAKPAPEVKREDTKKQPAPAQSPAPKPWERVTNSTGLDPRLPQECSKRLGRDLLSSINAIKAVSRSDLEVVDIANLHTSAIGDIGIVCTAVLVLSNGEKVPAEIRLYISSLGNVMMEVRLT